jgi:hypothetical protein
MYRVHPQVMRQRVQGVCSRDRRHAFAVFVGLFQCGRDRPGCLWHLLRPREILGDDLRSLGLPMGWRWFVCVCFVGSGVGFLDRAPYVFRTWLLLFHSVPPSPALPSRTFERRVELAQ